MNSAGLPVAVAASAAMLAPSSAQRFDTSILAGQIAESSQAMYKRDFRAFLTFAGSFERAMHPSQPSHDQSHAGRYQAPHARGRHAGLCEP